MCWSGPAANRCPAAASGIFQSRRRRNVTGGSIALSSVNVELDGNSAEGVLSFATAGRKTLQGTLASDTLDFSPYVSTVRLLTGNQREWNAARIGLDGLTGLDLDLRVSAAEGAPLQRQLRPHGDRRKSARRQADRHRWRSAGLRRGDQRAR